MAALAVLSIALPASAQPFPSKPVHVIVAYAPGGTGDFVARLLAGKLGTLRSGQNVVVENRAGASGAIGAQAVGRSAAPDGHTLLLGQTAEVAINQHWIKGSGATIPTATCLPVALATVVPLALVVPGTATYGTLAQMLQAQPTARQGAHLRVRRHRHARALAGEALKLEGARSNLTHVPYKGAGPALNDVVAGHVDMYFPGFPAAMPHVKAGGLKVLATSSAARSAHISRPRCRRSPRRRAALRTSTSRCGRAISRRAARRPPLVARLNREINAILADPEIRQKLIEAGADVTPIRPTPFGAFVKAESEKYLQIIRATGMKPE